MPLTHRYTLALGDGVTAPRVTDAEREVVVARLWAAGALGVWERPDRLDAWFVERSGAVPADGDWTDEPDHDWQAAWKATIEPVRAGRIVVVPTWLAEHHTADRDDVTLVLDPGAAFGSGQHATTTMCLEMLQEVEVHGRRVADIGTGSGILALAARLLGAERVAAVDTDPEAVSVARDNARRLGISLDLRVGSIEALPGQVDVLLANLVTDTVVRLADALPAWVAPDGVVIVSGIASERENLVTDALTHAGLPPVEARRRDGWTALRATAPA